MPTPSITKGDYLVVSSESVTNPDKKLKNTLIKVSSSDSHEVHGRVERVPHLKSEPVSVRLKNILLNLGPTPPGGSILGCNTESLYLGSKSHDDFNRVSFFTKPEKRLGEALFKAMDSVAGTLKTNRLSFILDLGIEFEVYSEKAMGSSAGWYLHSTKDHPGVRRIGILLGDSIRESASIATWEYVLLHELGHAIHYNYLMQSAKADAAWVEEFTKTVTPQTISLKDHRKVLKGFVSSSLPLKDFLSQLEEEDALALKVVLKWIRKQRGLSPSEINLLVSVEDQQELIKSVWPDVDLSSVILDPSVSQYACKHYRELFAEAFAFKLSGKKIPSSIESLLDKSLSFSRKLPGPRT